MLGEEGTAITDRKSVSRTETDGPSKRAFDRFIGPTGLLGREPTNLVISPEQIILLL